MSKQDTQESKKVRTIRNITKGYFVAALAGSFSHIVTSAYKMGAEHWYEAFATPLLIDGLAVIGMIMRSEDFSKRTNKIGFVLQCVMGTFSLAMNVTAGWGNLFGVVFGIALVACFILAEWLKDNIEGREVDSREEQERQAEAARQAAQAIVDAENARIKAEADALATKKAVTQAKRKATIKRNKRTKAAQEAALESLLQPVTEPGVRVLRAA